mgnify:CR=1 FL=1
MKALIIGGAGFVGHYLVDQLLGEGDWTVSVTKLPQESFEQENVGVHDLNLLAPEEISSLLRQERPDYIFHLAAQSSVGLSWKNPGLTIDINIKGAVNMLDAVRAIPDYHPRILVIGSGEEYGYIRPEETPVSEENPVRPGNIYAATKVAQNMICGIYARAYHMDIVLVRAFNHIGPAQKPMYVVADFCKQVADIEKGKQEPVMHVGNLAARRDFTNVRDVVRAYSLLVRKGKAGETYNVGSGHAISMEELLARILALSTAEVRVEVDPAKLRPLDIPVIEAEIGKLVRDTGWAPTIPLDQTIAETLAYWRSQN